MDQSLADKLAKTSPDVLVDAYIQLRDKRDDLRRAEKRITAQMEIMAQAILSKLSLLKIDSYKAVGFNVYRYDFVTAQITDREALLNHVVENKAWELLDLRANKDNTLKFEEVAHQPPPGVSVNRMVKLGVRKA